MPKIGRFYWWKMDTLHHLAHETMHNEGVCPRCGERESVWRDSVHNGVGVMYGPYGCPCGWSEWQEYDLQFGAGVQSDGSYTDQQGVKYPAGNLVAIAMRNLPTDPKF